MVERTPNPLPKTITGEAARWVAENFDGELAPDRQAELDRWLAADPRHAEAYAEMQSVWAQMGAIPNAGAVRVATPLPPELPKDPRNAHRHRRWAVPAIAASVALVTIGTVQDWPTRMRADEMTAVGERRTVSLPDGSRVQLDTQSAIAVDYTSTERAVRLLKGAAIFNVASDRQRPFTVEAAGGETTALGTRFLVRLEEDKARVVVDRQAVRSLLEVDLVAPIDLVRLLVPHVPDGGRIINVSSIAGQIARSGDAAYTAAKGGLEAVTRALAAEFGTRRITVNAVAPGYFATEANRSMVEDSALTAYLARRTALGRWGDPHELAGAVVFLASSGASYITGHVLAVDGGYLSHL